LAELALVWLVPDPAKVVQEGGALGRAERLDRLIGAVVAVPHFATGDAEFEPFREPGEVQWIAAFVALSVVAQADPDIQPYASVIDRDRPLSLTSDDLERPVAIEVIRIEVREHIATPAVEFAAVGRLTKANDKSRASWHEATNVKESMPPAPR
jgi:hypothetical protein